MNIDTENHLLSKATSLSRIVDIVLQSGKPTRKHSCIEFTLVSILEGKGSLHINDRTIHLFKDDIVFINPLTLYFLKQEDNQPLHYLIMEIKSYSKIFPLSFFPDRYYQLMNNLSTISLINRAILSLKHHENQLIRTYQEELLLHLLKLCYISDSEFITEKSNSTNISPRIQKAKEYINSNYHQKINLAEIANISQYELTYFSKKFHREIKVTPRQYWVNKRLEQAEFLLKHTSEELRLISQKIGYSNYSHFSYQFKMKYGLSPNNYRQKHLNNK